MILSPRGPPHQRPCDQQIGGDFEAPAGMNSEKGGTHRIRARKTFAAISMPPMV